MGTGGTGVGAALCCGGGCTFWNCWFYCCWLPWFPHLRLGWFLHPGLYLFVDKSWFCCWCWGLLLLKILVAYAWGVSTGVEEEAACCCNVGQESIKWSTNVQRPQTLAAGALWLEASWLTSVVRASILFSNFLVYSVAPTSWTPLTTMA